MHAMTTPERTGCGAGHDALTVAQARERLRAEVAPVGTIERLALRAALGRVLAEDVRSPIDVPSHTNSAVDGYALRAEDLPRAGQATLRCIGTALAGRPLEAPIGRGECARVMTGAPLPPGADTVIMQEHAERSGERVTIGARHRPGENVRAAGEDLARGEIALATGRRLQPADLGLLASIGRAEAGVYRRPRVAFFSTGDELRSIGEPLGPGLIYDSNRYTLWGMLTRLGVEAIDLGVVRDTREAVRGALRAAAASADAVLTSGGVSVGEADCVKEALAALGRVGFWQVAMKPGRPLAFGRIGDAAFFGLPGNPVAVMVSFYQFVEPALRRIAGEREIDWERTGFRVPCASRLKKRTGRTEFQRGVLEPAADGTLTVRATGHQGSGVLRSMSVANCFIVLPPDSADVEPGALVEVQPFHGIV